MHFLRVSVSPWLITDHQRGRRRAINFMFSVTSMFSAVPIAYCPLPICHRVYATGAAIHHVMPFLSMTPAFRCPYGLSSGALSDAAPAARALA
jgi:hypothetical protein